MRIVASRHAAGACDELQTWHGAMRIQCRRHVVALSEPRGHRRPELAIGREPRQLPIDGRQQGQRQFLEGFAVRLSRTATSDLPSFAHSNNWLALSNLLNVA